MKLLFTFFFIVFSSFSFATDIDKFLSQLSYARFCADSLHDSEQAINGYDELLLILENERNDSIRLIAETERIILLKRTGDRTELFKSLPSAIVLAQKCGDYEQLSMLLTIKGFMYHQLGFKKQAFKVLNDSHEAAVKIKNLDDRNLQLAYHSGVMSSTKDISDEKVFYLIKSYRYFMEISQKSRHYRRAQISGNTCYGRAFIERGELDSAQHFLSLAASHLDSNEVLLDDHFAILNLAKLYCVKKDYRKAEKWLLYALRQAKIETNLYHQSAIFFHLYYTEFNLGENQQANQFLQEFAHLKEKIDESQIESINLVGSLLSIGDDIGGNSPQQKGVIGMSVVIVLLLCTTIGWRYGRDKKKIQVANAEASTSAHVVVSNEDLRETPRSEESPKEESLKNVSKEITVDQIKELNQLVKNNDPSFMVKFHEYLPTFARTVSGYAFPPLNSSEIEVCAYTKLNFSTKDIALYRQYTIRSVENKKYRIRKKLLLAPEADFVVYIASIS